MVVAVEEVTEEGLAGAMAAMTAVVAMVVAVTEVAMVAAVKVAGLEVAKLRKEMRVCWKTKCAYLRAGWKNRCVQQHALGVEGRSMKIADVTG